MKKQALPLAIVVSLVLTLITVASTASAFSPWTLLTPENFGLGDWEGQLQGGYEYEDQQSSMGTGNSVNLERNRFDERVSLENQGFYIIDPRLLSGSTGVNLDFLQEQDRSSGARSSLNGLLYGYNGALTLFGEKPISGSLYANRHQSQVSTDFGGRTENTNSTIGGTIRVFEGSFLREKLPYFTSTLDVREDTSDQSTTQQGQTYKLEDTRDNITFDANKGFENADLGVDYNFVKDVMRGTNAMQYQTQHASTSYSLDFGPLLNRRWDSRISWLQRSGSFSETYLTVDEKLGIQHFRNLATAYEYQYTHMDVAGQTTDVQFGDFTLTHTLYNNLATALSLIGTYQTLNGGTVSNYGATIAPTYTHSIPWGGTFFINSADSYSITDNSLQSGNIQVVDEQHSAPPVFGVPFTLNNPFVITSTIVMVDNRGGGRIPTVPGVDYNVVQLGNQTQIVILPTTVVIQPNDPLLISYTYQVPSSAKYSTFTWMVSTGVNFKYFDLNYMHLRSKDTLLSGSAFGFLNDVTEDEINGDVHKEWEKIDTRMMGSYEIYDSSFIAYTLTTLSQSLFWRPGWNVVVGATGSEGLTDYNKPQRTSTSEQLELSLDRFAPSGNSVRLFGRYARIEDSVIPTESDIEGGIEGRWVYGKVEVVPTFRWINRRWGNLSINDPHFMLVITRFL